MSGGLQGEACQGRGVPAGGHNPAGEGLWQRVGAPWRLDRPVVRRYTTPIAPAPGQRAEGARGVTSIA
jgi:hypothetical protein